VTGELARTISRRKQEMPIMQLLADPQAITARTCVNGGAWFDYPGTGMPGNPRDVRRYDRVAGLSLRWRMQGARPPATNKLVTGNCPTWTQAISPAVASRRAIKYQKRCRRPNINYGVFNDTNTV
jgi:hypothetical protein